MTYNSFRFIDYVFHSDQKTLTLTYGYDSSVVFTETYRFDFPFAQYDEKALDTALQHLFFIAGVSYYKAFVPKEITVEKGKIDHFLAGFLSKTYQKGLGEFWYVNKLHPDTRVIFPVNSPPLQPLDTKGSGLLVGIGGGKDSIVSVEALRSTELSIATWSLNHRTQLAPLVERISLPHYWVDREWDQQLKTLNEQGAYNGHVPISAIIAATGTIVSILAGRRDQVVSNEQSANEPTLVYQGIPINHQYSKSQEFERDYQSLLRHSYENSVRYYSLLRPLSELRIAELFSRREFQKYNDVFSSCNTAFRHGSDRLFWDGTCAKCAFVFLALTPFVPQSDLERLFSGKNLLLDSSLEQTYRQLLGIEGDKPLDCVGEVRESREAMHMAQKQYPELKKYLFERDASYDFRQLGSHEIPREIQSAIWHVITEDSESSSE